MWAATLAQFAEINRGSYEPVRFKPSTQQLLRLGLDFTQNPVNPDHEQAVAGTTQHIESKAAAPTLLWVGTRRRDGYSGGGSPITSHSFHYCACCPSNLAGAAASCGSIVRCSSPSYYDARHHQYEKRQSEFPRTVESDELPWHRGDTLYTDGAGPGRVDTHKVHGGEKATGRVHSATGRFIQQGQTKEFLLDQSNKERSRHSCQVSPLSDRAQKGRSIPHLAGAVFS